LNLNLFRGGLNADFGAPSAVVVHVQDLLVRSECTLDYHRAPSLAANTICIMHICLFWEVKILLD
jgi:hypothetical protein